MDHIKIHKPQKNFGRGCKMEGAIMMSNRTTKQECLAKKIFGLPPNMIDFTERIKAGMLLFLFEYEERKLYGVFEATSDGAMNILPDAFQSQGKLFPAQVLFRRVWMCRPLCEDEFSHAIIDNYYSPQKFNFDLSYDQVFKLVQLFHVRRINLKQDLHYDPNKIIRMFQNDYGNNRKGSRPEKNRKSHFSKRELDLHPNALQDASSLEISLSYEDPIFNACSDAADAIFDRYDPTDPKIGFIQESKYEEEHNSNAKENNKSDMNDSTYVVYDKSKDCYPPVIKSKLQSDIGVKRTSAFSRLSMNSNVTMKRKIFTESFKEPKKLESSTHRKSISSSLERSPIDESFADIRPSYKKIREYIERNILEDRSKRVESKTKVFPCAEAGTKLVSCTEAESKVVPCAEAETKLIPCIVPGTEAETKVVPCAEAETKVVPCLEAETNFIPCAADAETLVPCSEAETKVVPCAEAETEVIPCAEAETKTKKEVRSRNLLWFLKKTEDLQAS